MNGADRWAWAEIDLGAVAHNIAVLRAAVAPAAVWAVVKADGYGHGAVAVGRAALEAGAEGLCVALVAEGVALREAGIDAPILVLSRAADRAGARRSSRSTSRPPSTPANSSTRWSQPNPTICPSTSRSTPGCSVSVRIPTPWPHSWSRSRNGRPPCELTGVFSHLAVADEPDNPFTATQIERFDDALTHVPRSGCWCTSPTRRERSPIPRRVDRSSGPASPCTGSRPGHGVDDLAADLRPVMSLKARISYVKTARSGSRISYGRRYQFSRDTTVATIPLGYADGVPRRLSSTSGQPGGSVLIRGERCPIVGTITMDQLMVDCGDLDVRSGEEVVLIGEQEGAAGIERITATEWADQLGTIGYEIVCGISARVPRVVRP